MSNALTTVDLSRLLTHVVIHGGENPHALHPDTFERLTAAGLTHRTESESGDVEYSVTPVGVYVAGGMLDRAKAMITAATRDIDDIEINRVADMLFGHKPADALGGGHE